MTSLQLDYTGVLIAVFANQICLPIPSLVFLMAAGALSASGEMRASMIVGSGVVGCLAADTIWFCLGRRWGSRVLRLLCRFSADPRGCSKDAHEKFGRYGLPLLCVAKFVPGLDGLMPPLASAEGVSVASFLAVDGAGSFLWSGAYVGLGCLFSRELDVAIHWVQHFGALLGIAVGAPIILYAGWRGLALLRMIRRLQVRRMSPRMLARKLKSDRKIAVLDLVEFEPESDAESVEAIPGAFSVDPSRLRNTPRISVPDDVEIILYSSSGSDMVSARAALALKRIGVDKVWVLEGGLKAWRQQNFPVSHSREAPEAVAERVGVKLPEPVTRSRRFSVS